jgi:hypothetical protein
LIDDIFTGSDGSFGLIGACAAVTAAAAAVWHELSVAAFAFAVLDEPDD